MSRSRRYPSDLSDEQWALVEPLLPPRSTGGRPETPARRDVVDAILYVAHNGGVWRALPVDVPPGQTVYGVFRRWAEKGMTGRLHDALRDKLRARHGRHPPPPAGVVDSPSVQGAQPVGSDSRGYDKGKHVTGRKRFLIVDTLGLLLTVLVVPASAQDRDGARQRLVDHYFTHRRGRFLFADGGFAGRFAEWAARILKTTIEIVRKKSGQKGFQALPKRWVVERTLAWLTAHRRLVCDDERHPATATSFIRWAMIQTMVRRIAHAVPVARWQPRANTKSE